MEKNLLTWEKFTKYDNFVFDLDGTIYLDGILIPGAKETFNKLLELNKNVTILTNNSSTGIEQFGKDLRNLGLNCTDNNIINSTLIAINYINNQYPNKTVYLVGTKNTKYQLSQANINQVEENADIVLVSNDQELTTEKLTKACRFLQDGAIFLATNSDYSLAIKNGYFTCDCGSISKMIELTVDRTPKFLGKPNKNMLDYIKYGKTIVIGDKLSTDIQLAINNNCDSLLVLTGDAKLERIQTSSIKPTYISDSINIFKK